MFGELWFVEDVCYPRAEVVFVVVAVVAERGVGHGEECVLEAGQAVDAGAAVEAETVWCLEFCSVAHELGDVDAGGLAALDDGGFCGGDDGVNKSEFWFGSHDWLNRNGGVLAGEFCYHAVESAGTVFFDGDEAAGDVRAAEDGFVVKRLKD